MNIDFEMGYQSFLSCDRASLDPENGESRFNPPPNDNNALRKHTTDLTQ